MEIMTMRFNRLLLGIAACVITLPAIAADHPLYLHPRELHFQQDGVFGTFDRAQLQRGFQVYKEVCSACHSLRFVSFRNLQDLGFSEIEIKAIAKGYDIADIDDVGEANTRKGLPADHFPSPYANPEAARAANNNAVPPDLSLMTKARHDGTNYVYSLLTGFGKTPPKSYKDHDGKMVAYTLSPNGHYNPYFPATALAMAAPLSDGQVTYSDGTKASVDQMAKDVATFLTWTAEPKLEARKKAGTGVLVFLALLIGFTFVSYKRIWANVTK
jgi:ubiquinol-cytochrome c reductase cytochrome c1 subunit